MSNMTDKNNPQSLTLWGFFYIGTLPGVQSVVDTPYYPLDT